MYHVAAHRPISCQLVGMSGICSQCCKLVCGVMCEVDISLIYKKFGTILQPLNYSADPKILHINKTL